VAGAATLFQTSSFFSNLLPFALQQQLLLLLVCGGAGRGGGVAGGVARRGGGVAGGVRCKMLKQVGFGRGQRRGGGRRQCWQRCSYRWWRCRGGSACRNRCCCLCFCGNHKVRGAGRWCWNCRGAVRGRGRGGGCCWFFGRGRDGCGGGVTDAFRGSIQQGGLTLLAP